MYRYQTIGFLECGWLYTRTLFNLNNVINIEPHGLRSRGLKRIKFTYFSSSLLLLLILFDRRKFICIYIYVAAGKCVSRRNNGNIKANHRCTLFN